MREKTDPQLGAIFVEAMKIWDGQKADGVPLDERVSGLAKTLRASWPFTREWKYLCVQCSDLGLVLTACPGDRTCGRSNRHLPHDFGRPCVCDKGRVFRDKPARPTDDDALESAARVRKPTRLGRM